MYTLNATPREGTGKGVAHKMRATARIPAVIYGGKQSNQNLSLDLKEFRKILSIEGDNLKTESLELEISGQGVVPALVREIQKHPISGVPTHVDFLYFDPNRRVEVAVPVHLVGEAGSPGIKRGGKIELVCHELQITCLAGKIPHTIEVSVATMDLGDAIHIQDITLPEGAEVHAEANFTICVMKTVKEDKEADVTTEEAVPAPIKAVAKPAAAAPAPAKAAAKPAAAPAKAAAKPAAAAPAKAAAKPAAKPAKSGKGG